MKNKITVEKIINKFNLNITNKDKADMNRVITTPSIHSLGLELSGVFSYHHKIQAIIGWGSKEETFFKTLKLLELKRRILNAITPKTPLIILSFKVSDKIRAIIEETVEKYRIPVAHEKTHLSVIRATIGTFLIDAFSENEYVHASLVVINSMGIMIIGESGIGKSEAVLELIKSGHSFVSDDTVMLKRIGDKFIGSSPKITKDFLEARGIGIINIPHIYGVKSVKEFTEVDLVVELIDGKKLKNPDRLGNSKLKYKILNGILPLVQIPVNQGRSISSLIEAAANVYKAKKDGMDPVEMIENRSE